MVQAQPQPSPAQRRRPRPCLPQAGERGGAGLQPPGEDRRRAGTAAKGTGDVPGLQRQRVGSGVGKGSRELISVPLESEFPKAAAPQPGRGAWRDVATQPMGTGSP